MGWCIGRKAAVAGLRARALIDGRYPHGTCHLNDLVCVDGDACYAFVDARCDDSQLDLPQTRCWRSPRRDPVRRFAARLRPLLRQSATSGVADSPDAVLQEVRKLEAEGRVWDVLVAESYPPRIHVTGPWPEIQQLKAVAGLPYFVTIAEAMTSPDPATGIDAGYRLFSVPSLPQLCTAGPARLRIHNAPGSLRIGEPYPLGQLVVTAEDADGELLSAVPIRLDAEVTLPAVVDLRAEALADGMLVPIAAGDFAIRAQTVCPATSAVAVTYASVLHDQ